MVRHLLQRGGFRRLLVGQAVSSLGDWMATVALLVLVLDLTGSSAAVGGMLVLRLLPAVVAGPLTARLIPRLSRRRTMLAMDLARAGMAVLVPLVAAVWWVYLWAFAMEVGGLVFLPARDSSVPDLTERQDLSLANGAILASSYGTIPLSAAAFAAVSAAVAAVAGPGGSGKASMLVVFAIDAASFLVSFAMIRGLRMLDAAAPAAVAERAPGGLAAVVASDGGTSGSFLRAFEIPLVRGMLPATVTVALGIGTLFSVGVVFVREVLGATEAQFGILIALFGIGAAAGLAVLPALGAVETLGPVRVGVAAQGAVVIVMSLFPTPAPAFLGAAAFGATTSATLAIGMSCLQTRLVGDERVLAFSAFHVTIRASLGLAALTAGFAVDLVGSVSWPLVGDLEPARLVLLCSGLVVLAGAGLVHEPSERMGGSS